MIPKDALNALAAQHRVSNPELEVLSLAMDGISTAEIAKLLGINATAVRKRLGEVYKKFDIAGNGPGKLAKLQQILMARYQSDRARPEFEWPLTEPNPNDAIAPSPEVLRDWGEAGDVDSLYGREEELEQLKRWIVDDQCRLIALLGLGGMGKTALALKLAERIQSQFERVVWRSLNHSPFAKDLLADLLNVLSNGQEPDGIGDSISQLLNYLKKYRCLLILDNTETILRSDDLAGHYKAGYEDYEELLRRVGETPHRSCLIITSSEKPKEFVILESKKVRAFQVNGLKGLQGREIFKDKGRFSGSEDEWQDLIERYAGNPLALKIVAATIQELFGGSISEFLQQKTTVFGTIYSLLEQQFGRLSLLEKEMMYWLAINREPVSLSDLRQDLVPPVPQYRLLEALESLGRRSLIERDRTLLSLQPVVTEYVIDRFINRICEEIKTQKIVLFNSHAVIKAQAKDYLRERQIAFVLQPLTEKLIVDLGSEKASEVKLTQILLDLQHQAPLKPGYAAGNALNLLCQLHADISDRDFSSLAVWQAYLQDVDLHRVNFARADLSQSVFSESLGSILSVAFSPDGTRLATGDVDYKIRVWHVTEGGQQFTCDGHTDWVRAVQFSPNGHILASGSHDKTVRLWDVSTGQCLQTLEGHTSWVRSVVFSPDGRWLATCGADHTVRLWDVQTGRCLNVLAGHTKVVRSVCFDGSSQILASGSSDRTIKLWDIRTGHCIRTLHDHARGVRSVAFCPTDDRLLASGSSDRTVKLWDVATGTCLQTLKGHIGWVWSVVFSSDGQMLASGSEDQTVGLWDIRTGECLKVLSGHTGWVRSVAFSPDDQILASGSEDQTIKLWDVKTERLLKTFQGYGRGVRSVAFSWDGKTLASGGEDRTIRLWNVRTGQCLISLQKHTGRVWSVAFSPDGRTLASGSEDKTVRFWDIGTGQCLKTLKGHEDGVLSVAFSSDQEGRIFASGSSDGKVRLWDAATGQCLKTLAGHTDWVWSIAFSPDGKILASGSSDLTVRLWDVESGACRNVLKGHTHWIRSVAFSPDGKTLASSSVGRTVRLWNVETGESLKLLKGYSSGVRSVAFSPNGEILASGGNDHVVRLWDIASGKCLQVLEGHLSRVRSVAFSMDGQLLASGSNDERIRLWNLTTGEELNPLLIEKPYQGMNITGATGLTAAQKATLMKLGAFDASLP